MEYLFLGLIVWAFISLPALIYAGVVDGRRRRDAENFNRKLAELTREMEILERRTRAVAASTASAGQSGAAAGRASQISAPCRAIENYLHSDKRKKRQRLSAFIRRGI